MKEEINQTELEEIEKEIEAYFSLYKVPPPAEQKVNETIANVKYLMDENKQSIKQSNFSRLRNELKNLNIQLIISQLIILCSSLYVLLSFSPRAMLGFVFCVAPLSMVLGLTECLKNKTYQMTELEMTFKYGTGQLFLMRFILGTIIHFVTVTPMIILSGFLDFEFLTTLLIVWLIPALTVAVLFLLISFYLPSRLNIAALIIVAWLAGSLLLSAQQQVLYEWISLPVTIHVITLVILVFSLYKIIAKYQEEYSNGIEYSIN
ncbi:hypothetical protein ACQCVH_19385 [Bacillus infantis]|uniref:hypothetical protein n=1 Tax=Bacillus infantis TaxID=324767 RepID=UPI003CF73EE9